MYAKVAVRELIVMVALATTALLACKKEEAPPPPVSTASATWKSGDLVDVEWNKSWWAGKVLAIDGAKYKIHYLGWASSWDESVGPERLRAPTPGAQKGSAAE